MYVSPQLSDCRKTSFVDKKGVAGAEPPYRSSAICATASCSGFVWLTASILAWTRGGRVDYNIKCNTKKYGHHTHFRVKCNYHKTKGTEVEYEVLYTFYTI